MTKTEFRDQFKRLRTSGYRLPVWEGVTVEDVLTEWYDTFGNCSAEEFSLAINQLKQTKTDTFWPATGEIWQHIFEIRKARRIRASAEMPREGKETPQQVRQELAGMFRDFATKLSARMAMPKVSEGMGEQAEPDHVQIEREDRERGA